MIRKIEAKLGLVNNFRKYFGRKSRLLLHGENCSVAKEQKITAREKLMLKTTLYLLLKDLFEIEN